LGLMAVTPLALGQKMHKCDDGKGGVTFQQAPCPETPQEAEAREKETERLKKVEALKKEEEERKKAEALAKLKERDKVYQQQMEERAREAKKAQEA
jgi:transcription initiation factor IIF auxiliary subunit